MRGKREEKNDFMLFRVFVYMLCCGLNNTFAASKVSVRLFPVPTTEARLLRNVLAYSRLIGNVLSLVSCGKLICNRPWLIQVRYRSQVDLASILKVSRYEIYISNRLYESYSKR